MVCVGGVCAGHRGLQGKAREVVRGDALLVLQREVGDGVLHLGVSLQKQTPGARVLGAQVGVAIARGHGAVDVVEEALEARQDLLVREVLQEGVEHAVKLAHIHGTARDRRNVLVQDLQVHEQVVQVVRRIQTEELAPLLGETLHVAADVARAVRRVALMHVADGVALEEPIELGRGRDGMLAVLGSLRQVDELLPIGEVACGNDIHELAHTTPPSNVVGASLHNLIIARASLGARVNRCLQTGFMTSRPHRPRYAV